MIRSPLSLVLAARSRMRMAIHSIHCSRRRRMLLSAGLFLGILAVALSLHLNEARRSEEPPQKAQVVSPETPGIPELTEVVGIFKPNQTITQVLLHQGIPLETVHQIVNCARPVYDLAKIKAEQLYYLYFTKEGRFHDFRYHVDDERYLTVYHDRSENRMVPVMKEFQYETRVEWLSGKIDSSLFSAVLDLGERDQLALDLAEIFGSDIDFYTDLQKGDSFRVLVEKKYLDGKFSKYGAILAADFTNQQKVYTGIRFEDENGKPAYYAPDGKALKKSFLKSPLKFGRITSRFSLARMHPILKILRPHLGVDYAAPVGTPVQAVASGIVTDAGFKGESGNMIKIRHSGGYETMYLHLSRVNVKAGERVSQGEVIGRVGSTGLSTGAHLDFRIRHRGKPVNPAKVIFPPGEPVSRDRFSRFAALRDKLMQDLRPGPAEIRQAEMSTVK